MSRLSRNMLIEILDSHDISEDERQRYEAQLHKIDPWNDMFHTSCANYPMCQEFGCGDEGDTPGHK